jgi:hypothetical protein
MKRTSMHDDHKMHVVSIVGLVALFLLVMLSFNVSFASTKPVKAAALKPATTPTATLPGVVITSPANNAFFGQYAQIPITTSITQGYPSGVTKVEFYATLSGTTTLIGTATTAPYQIIWTVQQAGSYSLVARVYAVYGVSVESAPVSIFVAVRDPIEFRVTFTSPVNNSIYPLMTQIPLAVSFNIDPTTVREVDYYFTSFDPGHPLATVTPIVPRLFARVTTAPFNLNWAPAPGIYILSAEAYDIYPGDFGISIGSVTVTVQSAATVTPTVTPPPNYCKVNYAISNQWPGGFTANISITNTGPTTINGWTLAFTFPGNQKVTNLWNGIISQSGERVTVTNASWNGTLASQGFVNIGFNGSWIGSNTSPPSFTLNGHICT